MSFIDARRLTADQVRASLPLWRGTGLFVLVSDDVRAALGGDPDTTPEPRPLADLQRERAEELQRAIRAHVDAHLPVSEREALDAILAGLVERVAFGMPLSETEQGVAAGLMLARQWATRAIALGGEVAARCAACASAEELAAVTVDLASLGEPPRVTAGEVALALRGA